jgi:hypothetical protein
MSVEAQRIVKKANGRPTFEQAQDWGRECAGRFPPPKVAQHVDVLACAYSEEWTRCDLPVPKD